MSDLTWTSAHDLAAAVRAGEVKAVDVVGAHLERIRAVEPRVSAFLRLTDEVARADAEALDARIAAGEDPGPLAGVPVGIKDNMCMEGVETTAASKILAGYRPPYTATVVDRLRAAGAVVLGKTNLDEFAMGSSTESSAYGPTRNPWDPGRVPGGSSGGSAAAVAAGQVPISLGSDTGGSIRQPAALCGCVGMKPTYGVVSRYGLLAFASSLDQIGPFGRDCRDVALVLDAVAGQDPRDMTTVSTPFAGTGSFAAAAGGASLEGKTLGVVREYLELVTDPEVRAAVENALEAARVAGAQVKEVSVGLSRFAIPAYQIVSTAEASSNLARYDGVHYGHRTSAGEVDLIELYEQTRAEGFGAEVKRRILLGTFVLSSGFYDAYYLKGQRVRAKIREDFAQALEGVDAFVGPTSPAPAFAIGEKDDPLAMYAMDVFTVSTNLAGLPAVSIPCGYSEAGLPIGLQLTGRAFSDPDLLALARGVERALALPERRPPEGGRVTRDEALSRYELVVGMEVHAQLNTKTKLFCSCELEFAAAPNSRTCPVCLGHPGTLPVLNGEAFTKALAIALAFDCEIRPQTEFDRKNYYYPDLPKGYQISQMYNNVGGGDDRHGGTLKLLRSGRTIRMHNVHLEEDAGKLSHVEGASSSAVDLNRAGTPLAEIVTEPDFRSVEEVDDYMDTLTELLRALDVSHCRMQEGNLRFEASVSVRCHGETTLGDRCEIKNLNSYAAVRKAVTYEFARQVALIESGKTPRQETRLWDDEEADAYEAGVSEAHKVPVDRVRALLPRGNDPWSGRTRFMRSKEDAHDYRYFPEPDMPAFAISAEDLEALRSELPELPGGRRERYVDQLGLPQKSAEVLARDYSLAAFFERLIELGVPAVDACNYTLNQISAVLNKAKVSAAHSPVPPEHVAGLHSLIVSDNGLSKDLVFKQVWPKVIAEGLSPEDVVVKYSIEGALDSAVIEATDRAWAANPKTVQDLLAGKKKAVGAIVGAVMRKLKGKASPQVINTRVAELLEKERQKAD